MLYPFLVWLISLYYKFIFRFEVHGEDNIPKTGGVVLSGNHISNHDPLVLALAQKRQLAFMAKEEVLKIPVLNIILKKIDVFPIKRGSGDIGAVKKAIEILKDGKMISIFPEGTRNHTQEVLAPFQSGAALIAAKSQSVIVPVAITSSYKPFSKIKIVFLKPINPQDYGEKPDIKLITSDLKDVIYNTLTKNN